MTVPLPNAGEPAAGSVALGRGWYEWAARITRALNGPLQLRSYTVATLPTPATDGLITYASDAGGGGVPVYSRSGLWLRFDDNTEVA